MKKETDLINNEALRNQCIEHYEVLEKVKQLLLIPGTKFATITEIANFYEVPTEPIQKLYQRNKQEIDMDGITLISANELIGHDCPISKKIDKTQFKTTISYENGRVVEIPNRGIKVFPRRAILRIGMLLRDSEIAKEVRTQLLNIEEKTSEVTKIADITEEQQLALSLGMAMASGDISTITLATGKMMDFKNRHIVTLEQDNKALAGEILEWKDRSKLNAGIRKLSAVTRVPFKDLWVKLYKNLQYKYSIDLKSRNGGKKPYIANLKGEEWDKVLKSFSAMCKAYGQSPADMFQQTLSI